MKKSLLVVTSENAPAAIGLYSQAILCDGMLYTSGQVPIDPASGQMVQGDISAQAHQVMKNLAAVLQQAGTDFSSVVKTTCFLADMADFAAFNQVYEGYFVSKPARSCVAVKALPKGALCEVELIAAVE